MIRRIICAAAVTHGKAPRRISFTRTCTMILAAWSALSLGLYGPRAMKILLEQIATLEIPDRPGRIDRIVDLAHELGMSNPLRCPVAAGRRVSTGLQRRPETQGHPVHLYLPDLAGLGPSPRDAFANSRAGEKRKRST